MIDYRVVGNKNIGKWSDTKYDNKGKTHCDMCGKKLWINPGGGIYCNEEHISHKQYD